MFALTNGTKEERAVPGLPTVTHTVRLGGRVWRMAAVADEAALLALGEERGPFPYGLLLWEGAIALGARLVAAPETVVGRRVLDVGCGVGLTAMVAAHLGARVTASDHDPRALAVAADNAAVNGVAGITYRCADWHAWPATSGDDGVYDVVLGADVAYDPALHGALLGVIDRCLAPGGRALLTDPDRHAQTAFVAAARAAGFTVTRTAGSAPAVGAAVGTARREVAITYLDLRRPADGTKDAGDRDDRAAYDHGTDPIAATDRELRP
jgi:predicted nicotinamide N-methyase